MGRLTGLDIRMASFRRTRLRAGYRRDAVDDYLIEVASQVDRYRADLSAAAEALDATRDELASTSDRADIVVEESHAMLQSAREVADATMTKALEQADEVIARAERSSTVLHRKAQQARDSAFDEARRESTDLISSARAQAAALLTGAREHRDELERAQAEAEIRIAYSEQRLTERAEALTAEARHLDELAAWLVDNDPLGGERQATLSEAEALQASDNAPVLRRAFRVVPEE
jgi:DivIVA domain-containing protein